MKKLMYLALMGLLVWSGSLAFAATPTDINFCSRGKTWNGKQYTTYTVRCSNGTKREITAWNKRKKWCVGNASRKNCSNDQLKAAKKACRK